MIHFLLTGIVCISLAIFLYLKKTVKKADPDYSYIIFKDYASKETISLISSAVRENREDEVTQAEEGDNSQKQQTEKLEYTPIAILNFEDQ